ncbi:MAG: hypothetical protein C3F17_19135 [Bradyrhizobiaceae bacterium]|nr:MAG: hypothetical protein C3F17_19135 [Bradyrhizobiaceae bacterium]
MSYYYAKTLDLPFEKAIEVTTEALKAHGFGVLTRIDVKDTLKQKIGADFHPYVILGACNPGMALRALQAEDKIGTMLPCNVIVQERDGVIEVAAVDPVASMQAIRNDRLADIASKVREALRAAMDELPAARRAGADAPATKVREK